MPEYLAPGVYIEEVSFRSKSIEGVSTTTTGFAGPTRFGPTAGPLPLITSLAEFERMYGDGQPLRFAAPAGDHPNYLWHAVNAFFTNGGKRLYVARVFAPTGSDNGLASFIVPPTGLPPSLTSATISARYPGVAGNVAVTLELVPGPNILASEGTGSTAVNVLRGAQDNDVVAVTHGSTKVFARLQRVIGPNGATWSLADLPLASTLKFASLDPANDFVRVVTLKVTVSFPEEPGRASVVYDHLAVDPRHRTNGVDDSFTGRFSADSHLPGESEVPITFTTAGTGTATGVDWLMSADAAVSANLLSDLASGAGGSLPVVLAGGDDGDEPADYTAALDLLAQRDEISIVAAPASGALDESNAKAVANELLSHAQSLRYRIAVFDSRHDHTDTTVQTFRGQLDSTYGALYYPWITVLDPFTRAELNVPPSGFVAGIYARNDIERGVFKAPANEVAVGAIGLQRLLTKANQDVLNPLGINCFRFFEGRGYRLWGARTISSDPEWKYVNLRRYFAYLEHSIDKGTQWAVFEPNGELLWRNVRSTISDFLLNEWQNGALLGDKPEKAFFVKCDRSTMTQNDLDNGRLVCLVGVAALRPAEFVIFRIGQMTARS